MIRIDEAVNILLKGEVLILPTDTLYGLSAIAYDYSAVKKVFDLKKRPYQKALPVHYGNIDLLREDCIITSEALNLMQQHWPGALTIVLEKKENSKLQFVGSSIAVRVPNCEILLNILNIIQVPLVMPSANISDQNNLFCFDQIQTIFHISGIKNDAILTKKPSTVISFLSGKMQVIRQGAIEL